MGILSNIFKKEKAVSDDRPILQGLVGYVRSNSVDMVIPLLSSNGNAKNPIAIPYTPDAIRNDFGAIKQCADENSISDSELAAIIATQMLKKHQKSIGELLAENGYETPPTERITYLNTYANSIRSLREFVSIGVKKYKISGCGDQRVCSKCAKQDGKKYAVNKAVIGKNAPPFCEKCRCLMIAEF